MTTVLIVTCSSDVHSDEIAPKLQKTGARVVRLNTDQIVDRRVELTFSDTEHDDRISIDNEECFLSELTSVWYRRPETPQTGVVDCHQREFAEKEIGELLRQLYLLAPKARWVSKYQSLDVARRKIPQLHMAKRCGMRVPKTVATNSPSLVRRFFDDCDGRIIYKTLHAPVIQPFDGPELWGVPTTIIEKHHLERIDLVRPTGGIFQEYIEKAYEVRVTIIGNALFASKIDSQADPRGRTDWRDAVANQLVSVSTYSLPPVVANQCLSIVENFDLAFGAIDLICSPTGEYIFLELNCNGQWLWVEDETGQPLSEAMVRLLTTA